MAATMQQAAAQQAQAPAPGQQGQQPGPNYPMASLYVGDLAPEVIIITSITSIILDINISLLLIIIITNIIIIVLLCMAHLKPEVFQVSLSCSCLFHVEPPQSSTYANPLQLNSKLS